MAETCDATGCTWTATYTEPDKDTAGNPLAGQGALLKTTIFQQVGTAAPTSVDVPATKPAGGGAISVTTAPKVSVAPGQSVTVKWWYTGTNISNLTGPSSNVVTITKDRTGENPPAAHTDLSVR
jgi:hypothetical protein